MIRAADLILILTDLGSICPHFLLPLTPRIARGASTLVLLQDGPAVILSSEVLQGRGNPGRIRQGTCKFHFNTQPTIFGPQGEYQGAPSTIPRDASRLVKGSLSFPASSES